MRIIGQIERVPCPGPRDFSAAFEEVDRPVILTGALDGWAATRTWSADYFRERLGDVPVRWLASRSHLHPDLDADGTTPRPPQASTLSEYLDRITRGPPAERAGCYLTGDETTLVRNGGQLSTNLKPLMGDFQFPPFVDLDRLKTVGLWLSAAGVRSRLHYDANGAHNLNAQVTGEKHVLLFSPDQLARLYPYPATRSRAANFSRVDVDAPDDGAFPLFRDGAALEGVLHAGEMLFLPAFWFHTFRHTGEFNSNLNFWWAARRPALTATSLRSALAGELSRWLADGTPGGLPARVAELGPEAGRLLDALDTRLSAGGAMEYL